MEEIAQQLFNKRTQLNEEIEKLNILYKQKSNYLSLLQEQFNILEGELREIKKREGEMKSTSLEKEVETIVEKKEEIIKKLDKEKEEIENINFKIKEIGEELSRISLAISILNKDIKSFSEQLGKMPPLQSQGIRILMAIEEERKRIARDVHDGPAQMLANVVLRLELLEKLLNQDPEKGKEELSSFKEIVKESLRGVRNFIFDLRPMTLDDLGLLPTLKRYIKNLEEHFPIFIELIIIGEEKRISNVIEVTLFRIIQEALSNVIRHASAKSVKIILEVEEKMISVGIKDDGVGFLSEQYLSKRTSWENLGLVSMRERTEILGGIFSIKSKLGEGTQIFTKIPLETD